MTGKVFTAQVRSHPELAIIDLDGEINVFAEEALNHAYAEAEVAHPSRIVLNFSHVGYINSTGIALIVALLARARKSNHSLSVYGLNDHYTEIFQITRLADFINIFPDENSALSSAPPAP